MLALRKMQELSSSDSMDRACAGVLGSHGKGVYEEDEKLVLNAESVSVLD